MSNEESVEDYAVHIIARRIAGDIVLSSEPGTALRKWREYFGASQQQVAKIMGVSSSVVSDYEKNRRIPGAKFIRRYVNALTIIDKSRGWPKLTKLTRTLGVPPGVVLDMRDFEEPLTISEISEMVNGIILAPTVPPEKRIYGYTVVDSIKAIASLSGSQFYTLLGGTPERAIVFTGVRAGRSPMVAVRVSPVKPSLVIIHGPRRHVDPLAVKLAELEGVPLVLSLLPTVQELVYALRSKGVALMGAEM